MKLKNKYILRSVADKTVAIAVENGNEKTEDVLTLNSTGAFIFSKINDGADKDTVVSAFFDEYEVTREEAEKAVEGFIEGLKKAGLLA